MLATLLEPDPRDEVSRGPEGSARTDATILEVHDAMAATDAEPELRRRSIDRSQGLGRRHQGRDR